MSVARLGWGRRRQGCTDSQQLEGEDRASTAERGQHGERWEIRQGRIVVDRWRHQIQVSRGKAPFRRRKKLCQMQLRLLFRRVVD